MMEFKNNKNYFQHILITSVVIMSAIGILYFWKGGNISAYIFFLLLLETIFLSRNFTKRIVIENGFIHIYYYKWMQKRTLKLRGEDIQTKIATIVANRAGTKYKRLDLFFKEKIVYKISSNTGFDEEDLKQIQRIINRR